jgi:hypothetical protein
VLQAGGFGLVVLDLAEVPAAAVRRLPFTTWLRLQRVLEGSTTACIVIGAEPTARSSGGITIALRAAPWSAPDARPPAPGPCSVTRRSPLAVPWTPGLWAGETEWARLLLGPRDRSTGHPGARCGGDVLPISSHAHRTETGCQWPVAGDQFGEGEREGKAMSSVSGERVDRPWHEREEN